MTIIRWNNLNEASLSGKDGGLGKWSGRKHNVLLTLYEKKVQFNVAKHSSVLPYKSSTSNYWPNALLKLRFWPLLFWNLLLLPPPDRCPLKFRFPSRCPLKPLFPSRCPLKPRLPSRCPLLLRYPSRGPSSSGCSVATESCQRRESCHFSCWEMFVFTCFGFYWIWFNKALERQHFFALPQREKPNWYPKCLKGYWPKIILTLMAQKLVTKV